MSVAPLEPAHLMRVLWDALPLTTERLVLRTLEPGDLDRVAEYRNDPATRLYMYSPMQTEAELMAYVAGGAPVLLRDGQSATIGIEHDGRIVGDLMLKVVSLASRQVELGWVLHRDARGTGFATEAAAAALRLALDMGAHRVFAHLDPANEASARVCERIGMVFEGGFVDDEVNPATGEFGSSAFYAIRA